MNLYDISQELSRKYEPKTINLGLHKKRATYLSTSIIPDNILAHSGEGAVLQTSRGELLDLGSMTVNCILGQNDPWVNANMMAYLASGQPSFLTTRIGGDYYYKLADRLLRLTGRPHDVINHRQSNGTDVTELAVLAAYNRRREGQTTLVSFEGSYHGQGLTAYHSSYLQQKHKFLIHEAPVVFLEQPAHGGAIDSNGELSREDIGILEKLVSIAPTVFAVIIEPIQVNNSVNTPSKAFMRALSDVCGQHKIALIYDEVQTGCGWLGVMTAAERYGTQPNLFTLSKALTAGNGPLAALISDRKYQDIPNGTAAKTNGADIRSLVAANAVLDRLFGVEDELLPNSLQDNLRSELKVGLLNSFTKRADALLRYLEDIRNTWPEVVCEIRGDGLIRGLRFTAQNKEGAYILVNIIQQRLFDRGVFVRHSKDVLIIKPPVVIADDQLQRAFRIVKQVIGEVVQ